MCKIITILQKCSQIFQQILQEMNISVFYCKFNHRLLATSTQRPVSKPLLRTVLSQPLLTLVLSATKAIIQLMNCVWKFQTQPFNIVSSILSKTPTLTTSNVMSAKTSTIYHQPLSAVQLRPQINVSLMMALPHPPNVMSVNLITMSTPIGVVVWIEPIRVLDIVLSIRPNKTNALLAHPTIFFLLMVFCVWLSSPTV